MGIFSSFFRLLPEWARQLPRGLRPSRSQVSDIEAIRTEYGVRHDEIVMHLMSHNWTTRRVLRQGYQALKSAQPSLDRSALLAHLLQQRIQLGGFPSLLGVTRSSPLSSVAAVIARFKTIDDLADEVTREEHAVCRAAQVILDWYDPLPHPVELGRCRTEGILVRRLHR